MNERTLSTAKPWLDKLRRKGSVIPSGPKLLYNEAEFFSAENAEEFTLRKIQREPIHRGDRGGVFYKK